MKIVEFNAKNFNMDTPPPPPPPFPPLVVPLWYGKELYDDRLFYYHSMVRDKGFGTTNKMMFLFS